ncbi:hypothetical protein H696_05592 [Fonticula alba]|uniref:Nucleotide-diphospho-sugar transferase domain-containing protein n=1 Tax=Fonticula alba TaxID=691883 RepID=A0A058Z2W5_FONAL|nr:hypothetical protein H696_05592 [Fonticula alba]KCV67862.1 hypothetical protein H696_05592 [Fonticula alba]|eukprot:XP_009497682.1 hypothetical protein H696_05592 [Fonticula alba]
MLCLVLALLAAVLARAAAQGLPTEILPHLVTDLSPPTLVPPAALAAEGPQADWPAPRWLTRDEASYCDMARAWAVAPPAPGHQGRPVLSVALVTEAFLDVADNWLRHVAMAAPGWAAGRRPAVALFPVGPPALAHELRRRGIPFRPFPRSVLDTLAAAGGRAWRDAVRRLFDGGPGPLRSAELGALWAVRMGLLQLLLECGLDVLHSDLDAVWLGAPDRWIFPESPAGRPARREAPPAGLPGARGLARLAGRLDALEQDLFDDLAAAGGGGPRCLDAVGRHALDTADVLFSRGTFPADVQELLGVTGCMGFVLLRGTPSTRHLLRRVLAAGVAGPPPAANPPAAEAPCAELAGRPVLAVPLPGPGARCAWVPCPAGDILSRHACWMSAPHAAPPGPATFDDQAALNRMLVEYGVGRPRCVGRHSADAQARPCLVQVASNRLSQDHALARWEARCAGRPGPPPPGADSPAARAAPALRVAFLAEELVVRQCGDRVFAPGGPDQPLVAHCLSSKTAGSKAASLARHGLWTVPPAGARTSRGSSDTGPHRPP